MTAHTDPEDHTVTTPDPLDCCPGEPFMGDPNGLHTFDCPVYLEFVERMYPADAGGREHQAEETP